MSKRFISTVLAVTMTITTIVPLTAAPAMADNARSERRDDAAKFLMGAAALAIVGTAIAQSGQRDKHESPRKKEPPRKVQLGHQSLRGALPGRCLVDLRGQGQAFDARCLAGQGVRVRSLPRHCEVALRSRSGLTNAYTANCLGRSGYGVDGGKRHGRDDDRRGNARPHLARPFQR